MPRKSNKRSNKKTRTKRRIRTKKQRPIMMIGCSKKNKIFSSLGNKGSSKCGSKCHMKKQKGGTGCGSCGCPMAPLSLEKMNQFGSQKGGNCAQCSAIRGGGGSNFFKPPAPIPGPILGSPWSTLVKGLPGENGISGDRNYLASYASSITNDPQQQMSMLNSGYKFGGGNNRRHNRRHRKTNKRGGSSFIPTDLLNLGRNVNYSINSTYNTLKGYNPPVNPLPYKHQLTDAFK